VRVYSVEGNSVESYAMPPEIDQLTSFLTGQIGLSILTITSRGIHDVASAHLQLHAPLREAIDSRSFD
jgi:hypothetical protein